MHNFVQIHKSFI